MWKNRYCHQRRRHDQEGYNEEADKLRHAKTEGKTWLAELEARERDKTGIKNLKIKYNKVFGYYFEVTNSLKIWFLTILSETDACQRRAVHYR